MRTRARKADSNASSSLPEGTPASTADVSEETAAAAENVDKSDEDDKKQETVET
jgi:hypothetical protein